MRVHEQTDIRNVKHCLPCRVLQIARKKLQLRLRLDHLHRTTNTRCIPKFLPQYYCAVTLLLSLSST